jgi:O-antigen/teichoic acid export membrane protein
VSTDVTPRVRGPRLPPRPAAAPGLFAEADFETPSFVSAPLETPGRSQRHVVRGSIWFVGAVGTGAALSFLYWLFAARLDHDAVGPASGLWAQVQLVNYLTGMGLPIALARYGSGRPRTVHVLFKWALLYTAVTSMLGTLVYGALAPQFIAEQYLAPLFRFGTGVGLAIFFVLITGMSFALLVEVRLVTLRQWRWVFGRMLVMSVSRLPLLLLPVFHHSPMGLLLLIAGMPALSGAAGVIALRQATPRRDRGSLLPLPPETVPALKFASVNYLGMLAAQAPQFGLPVVVAGFVSPDDYAAFYMAWQITVMIFLVPHTIGQIVLTEGGRGDGAVNHQVRLGLVLSLGIMVTAAVGAAAAARLGLVTRLFGPEFALTAELLPWLVAAGIPWAVTCVCLAKARVEGDHLRTVVITVGFAVFTLVPATVMTARAGVAGTTGAWLVGNTAAALLAVLATVLLTSRSEGHLVPSKQPAGAA